MPNRSYQHPAKHPLDYPEHGGFPYLNIAKWYNVPYEKVIRDDEDLSEAIQHRIREVAYREHKRSQGEFGPLSSYGV